MPLDVDSEAEVLFPNVLEAAQQYFKDEERLNNIRQYLNMLRHAKFEFNEELTGVNNLFFKTLNLKLIRAKNRDKNILI